MGFTGSLEKMTIVAYSTDKFTGELIGNGMSVSINPEKYSRSYKICYNDVKGQGSSKGSPSFNKIPSETVRFELVFDGTGAVASDIPGVLPFSDNGIADEIEKFLTYTFAYNNKIHSPNFLMLTWGSFYFYCRLSSLNVTYTLFRPDGTPLRARADTTFIEYTNPTIEAMKANRNSPDMTHVMTVKEGDTLPLLCYRVYGSSVYYLAVARHNQLVDFQSLVPGTTLVFPPFEETTA